MEIVNYYTFYFVIMIEDLSNEKYFKNDYFS